MVYKLGEMVEPVPSWYIKFCKDVAKRNVRARIVEVLASGLLVNYHLHFYNLPPDFSLALRDLNWSSVWFMRYKPKQEKLQEIYENT